VRHNEVMRADFQRSAHYLTRIDRYIFRGALPHHLITQQAIICPKEQHPKLFGSQMGHCCIEVTSSPIWNIQHRRVMHFPTQRVQHAGPNRPQMPNHLPIGDRSAQNIGR